MKEKAEQITELIINELIGSKQGFICVQLSDFTIVKAYQIPECVLCLGNFDGVHVAHAELIRQTLSLADRIRISDEKQERSTDDF